MKLIVAPKYILMHLYVFRFTGESQTTKSSCGFLNWSPANMASSPTPSLWPLANNTDLEGMTTGSALSPRNSTSSRTLAMITFPITAVITLLGLLWNGTILWLLRFRIKRNAFSVYILNLAGADFTFLFCQLFFVMVDISTNSFDISLATLHFKVKWHFYSTFPTAKLVAPLAFSSYTMGMSLLAAISAERCLSVLYPCWYRYSRPKHLSTVVCTLLWLKSLLVCTLTGDSCGFLFRGYSEQACYNFTNVSAVLILLLVSVMCVSSLTLIVRVQCMSQRHHLTKMYIVILLTVLMFLLCGLPFGMYWLVLAWWSGHQSLNIPYYLVDILSCMNSSINPIIYFFVGSFRQRGKRGSLSVVLQRALGDETGGSVGKETSHADTVELSA
ncbi:mas-related G-protein coupled receptor member X1 [Dasypus novemcinctus]|uniref:mas-related G-protein coupled receptor member X1 n=1 Tax=Dasypus novemcinctus TaxID=9361 RepID=UPI00265E15EB|nr:mas-related G-protein coupled receptor member X1 [Dasypus novemcinctus]